jgi:hypothetical protein
MFGKCGEMNLIVSSMFFLKVLHVKTLLASWQVLNTSLKENHRLSRGADDGSSSNQLRRYKINPQTNKTTNNLKVIIVR